MAKWVFVSWGYMPRVEGYADCDEVEAENIRRYLTQGDMVFKRLANEEEQKYWEAAIDDGVDLDLDRFDNCVNNDNIRIKKGRIRICGCGKCDELIHQHEIKGRQEWARRKISTAIFDLIIEGKKFNELRELCANGGIANAIDEIMIDSDVVEVGGKIGLLNRSIKNKIKRKLAAG